MCAWKQLLEKMLKNIGILLEQEAMNTGEVRAKRLSLFPMQVSDRKLESFECFWSHDQIKTLNNKIQK